MNRCACRLRAPAPSPNDISVSRPSVADSVAFLRERVDESPRVVLVLGSGLGALADEVESPTRISYGDIPGFPRSTVEGHAGALVLGRLEGVPVAVMAGRFHLYEGWTVEEVVHPVRSLLGLGAEVLLVTNAAGGIRRAFAPGTLMLISDHVNFTGNNPLTGPVQEGEARFPDMSEAYDGKLREVVREVARDRGIPLAEGVYAALHGPSYETPAEVRILERLGADAVGMSTVPEVIVARARGARVVGISCITNAAAGLTPEPLSHGEVIEAGAEASRDFATLVRGGLAGMQ